MKASAGILTSGGAVFAALLASACCWLPLAFIGLGTSSLGIAGFFEAYRALFLGVTAVLLGAGYYFVYFRRPKCAPGDACAVPNRKLQRINKISLWVATVLVIAFATFPNTVGFFIGAGGDANAASAPTDVERVYSVSGMTCQGCVGHLHDVLGELAGVKSVEVSFAGQRAVVRFAQGAVDDTAVLEATSGLGYEASVVEEE
ncbi:MAG: hypothetical protein AUK47_05610 [Deltaproteobacteria bacterium CG2_30_63_29]|nr:MAG: hypothetical protein AUK47_05610 [Deltaproteobacteria bacterium CG2_30_63_29]PJB39483.1 MAG: hypothetical protein CO108_17195 [Deltaproteobacteria bacterium CG_4_9_14_3_um_filter_63_12]